MEGGNQPPNFPRTHNARSNFNNYQNTQNVRQIAAKESHSEKSKPNHL
jgi:hypothetical protein